MLINKREQVNGDDIKLAIDAHNENSFYRALTRETIENIAMRRNSNPIPQPKFYSNLIEQIPESDYTLTQPNFEVYDEEIQEKLKDSFLNQRGEEDSVESQPGKMQGISKRKREESKTNYKIIKIITFYLQKMQILFDK